MIRGGIATAYVSDLERAIDYYVETLGFKLTARHGDAWAEVDAGDGLVIGLHPAGARGPRPGTPGSIAIGLTVDQPIEDVIAVLSNRGVAFRGPVVDDGNVRLAFFGDLDGNALYLCQRVSM
jgi:catechol 2,3-dioxygenase-like lactoylglutathione lyase family enzyme